MILAITVFMALLVSTEDLDRRVILALLVFMALLVSTEILESTVCTEILESTVGTEILESPVCTVGTEILESMASPVIQVNRDRRGIGALVGLLDKTLDSMM